MIIPGDILLVELGINLAFFRDRVEDLCRKGAPGLVHKDQWAHFIVNLHYPGEASMTRKGRMPIKTNRDASGSLWANIVSSGPNWDPVIESFDEFSFLIDAGKWDGEFHCEDPMEYTQNRRGFARKRDRGIVGRRRPLLGGL